jgi:HNH endonuclease
MSLQNGTRVQEFCDAVRARDRRCVVSGLRAIGADYNDWGGFQAAHIFPLAYEGAWNDHGYSRWISIPPKNESAGLINSVQNGLLLQNTTHFLFDTYAFSINPDVCILYLFYEVTVANDYLRMITRS